MVAFCNRGCVLQTCQQVLLNLYWGLYLYFLSTSKCSWFWITKFQLVISGISAQQSEENSLNYISNWSMIELCLNITKIELCLFFLWSHRIKYFYMRQHYHKITFLPVMSWFSFKSYLIFKLQNIAMLNITLIVFFH